MHAAIAQSDVAVNRTGGQRFGGICFVAVRIEKTITDRGWSSCDHSVTRMAAASAGQNKTLGVPNSSRIEIKSGGKTSL